MNTTPSDTRAKPTRILVVDDDIDTCANLADILQEFGHEVRIAHDARSALRLLEQHGFDVVLLDLRLPEMDGLQLYRELKQRSPMTVAILITGFADSDACLRAEHLGVRQVLSKPIDVPALLPLISDAAQQPLLLMIDDDRDFCDSLCDVLRERSFRVGIAGSAAEAARQMSRHDFQIILVDWRLPDADGLELLKELHQHQPDAQIVLLTAYRHELNHVLEMATLGGVDVLFYKPLEMDRFLSTLSHLTSR